MWEKGGIKILIAHPQTPEDDLSIKARWASQLQSLTAFRPFFPLGRTLADIPVLALQVLRGTGSARSFPFVVNLTLTALCPASCPYCFNAAMMGGKRAGVAELDIVQYRILAKAWARHRPGIFISGGEPLQRLDLPQVVEAFRARGMPVGLVTSGVGLDDGTTVALGRVGLDAVLVSLHGGPQLHDRTMGMRGAFRQAMGAVKRLAGASSMAPPMVNYVLGAHSIHDLPGVIRRLDRLGPYRLRLSHLLFLSPPEVRAQLRAWAGLMPQVPLKILSQVQEPKLDVGVMIRGALESPQLRHLPTRPVLSPAQVESWYGPSPGLRRRCLFVWRSVFVDPWGTVYPCQSFHAAMGELGVESMETIWNNRRYRILRRALRKGPMPGCSRCCKF